MLPGTCHKDSYLQASFNGVAFECIEAASTHGRRGAEGEFPFSSTTGYVDMGRKLRRYEFTARLADNDHETRAVLLIAACEAPGPGILIHPTRGVLNAACTNLQVRNNVIEQQGVTWIDLSFVEGELWNNGFGLVGSLLGLALRPLLEASSSDFKSTYQVRNEPVFVQDRVTATAQDTAVKIAQVYQRTGNSNGRATADMIRISTNDPLANDADVMDMLIRRGLAGINKESPTPETRFAAFRELANWSVAQDGTTPSGAALIEHLRITSAAYMAKASLERDYVNTNEALTALSRVVHIFNEEAGIAYADCSNLVFLELRAFLASYTRQMYELAYGRPRVIEYDFGGNVSPLVAAYSIWDDAKRARDISFSSTIYGNGKVQAVPA